MIQPLAATVAIAAWLKQSRAEIESVVSGPSMHPALGDGVRIRIRCEPEAWAPGDIIAFVTDPLIAHRVVARARCGSRTYAITRGDASWWCDAPVPESRILGIVCAQHDGSDWRPPRAAPRPSTRVSAALTWLSQRAIRTALMVSERLAIKAAEACVWLAVHSGHRRA